MRVHRLLTPDSMDERLLEIMNAKATLFDAYVRRSHLAESTADAVDISDETPAERIVKEEQERLGV